MAKGYIDTSLHRDATTHRFRLPTLHIGAGARPIMARSSSVLLLLLTLVSGMLVGVLVERGGRKMSAQSPPTATQAAPVAEVPSPGTLLRGASEESLYQELAKQYATFEHVNRTFEMVARVVSPAVVHIVAQKKGRLDESAKIRNYEETGSGVIVHGDGVQGLFVLTNNHVVENAKPAHISIKLLDGRAIHPDQVWYDAKADIAVLGLSRADLPAARLGNSDEIAVGDWVLALGSPFGLTHSVSQGIISARGRHMDELADVENQDFLQTDAAINPGNSGGPLVNMKGEVVGINNSIASNGGGNEGVGFSIPVNLARWIMTQLLTKGHVNRGALGIDLHPIFRAEDAAALGLDRPYGAWVGKVYPGSPAFLGGLHDGDVVVKYQGVEVQDLNHLINMVSMSSIGQPADLEVWRDKQRYRLRITIGDRERTVVDGAPLVERSASPKRGEGGLLRRPTAPEGPQAILGVELRTLDEAYSRQLGLPANLRGAVIVKVEPKSPAASALKLLDVIHTVNGRGVETAEEAVTALGAGASKDGLTLGFDRVVKGAVERRSVRLP